ncbi:MAG: FliH/SctL family protein [Tepidisphaeraceae bacterium]
MLAAAQAETDAIRKAAHDQAYAEGLAAGKRDGLVQGKTEGLAAGKKAAYDEHTANFTQAVATLTEIATGIEAERDRVIAAAESEVLPLALAIGRKVTKRLGEVDPGVVQANLNEAVRLISGAHEIRVTVNPDQLAVVEDLLPQLKQQWPTLKHVTFAGDAAVIPGGCRVQTAGGEIDAELDHQLDRLIEELIGVAGE